MRRPLPLSWTLRPFLLGNAYLHLAGTWPCRPRSEVPVRDRAHSWPPARSSESTPTPCIILQGPLQSHKQLSGPQIKKVFLLGGTDTNKCQAPTEMNKPTRANGCSPHIRECAKPAGVCTRRRKKSPQPDQHVQPPDPRSWTPSQELQQKAAAREKGILDMTGEYIPIPACHSSGTQHQLASCLFVCSLPTGLGS